MIIESVVGFGFWVVELIFSGLNMISLPFNLMTAIFDIMKFGVWVIGADLFAIVIANIFFWLSFKFTAGLVLFLYRLLPLT